MTTTFSCVTSKTATAPSTSNVTTRRCPRRRMRTRTGSARTVFATLTAWRPSTNASAPATAAGVLCSPSCKFWKTPGRRRPARSWRRTTSQRKTMTTCQTLRRKSPQMTSDPCTPRAPRTPRAAKMEKLMKRKRARMTGDSQGQSAAYKAPSLPGEGRGCWPG